MARLIIKWLQNVMRHDSTVGNNGGHGVDDGVGVAVLPVVQAQEHKD